MPNRWISFLKEFRGRSANKGLSLKDAMKKASSEYKKKPAAKKKKKSKVVDKEKLDKMVGGAIDPARVVMKNVDPPPKVVAIAEDQEREKDLAFHKLLRDNADFKYANMNLRLQPIADALLDFRPRNQIGFFQYASHFHKHPEGELMDRIEPLFSGKGASSDHPKLHKIFMDSFVHHPELLSLYTSH